MSNLDTLFFFTRSGCWDRQCLIKFDPNWALSKHCRLMSWFYSINHGAIKLWHKTHSIKNGAAGDNSGLWYLACLTMFSTTSVHPSYIWWLQCHSVHITPKWPTERFFESSTAESEQSHLRVISRIFGAFVNQPTPHIPTNNCLPHCTLLPL